MTSLWPSKNIPGICCKNRIAAFAKGCQNPTCHWAQIAVFSKSGDFWIELCLCKLKTVFVKVTYLQFITIPDYVYASKLNKMKYFASSFYPQKHSSVARSGFNCFWCSEPTGLRVCDAYSILTNLHHKINSFCFQILTQYYLMFILKSFQLHCQSGCNAVIGFCMSCLCAETCSFVFDTTFCWCWCWL